MAGEERRAITWPTWAKEPAELPGWYLPSKVPSRPHGSWGHRREVGEIRRGRREGLSGNGRRGTEGDHLAHLGLGSLLSSQADPLPSKAPLQVSWVLGSIGRRPRGEQET